MSADYTATLRARIDTRRRRADALQAELGTLEEPTPPASSLGPAQERYRTALAAYRDKRNQLTRDIQEAEDDIETAEGQIAAEATRQRAEAARQATAARSAAGTASRDARAAASGSRADTRLDLSAEARAEASAKAGAADVQRGRELRRAGEFAWGPDGIPYGLYDDDGKLRLLDQKEQSRVISMINAGQIKRTRTVQGQAQYPGQTPEPETITETASLPEGLGVGGYGGGGGGSGGRSARWPEEIEADTLANEESRLDIEKKRRDLLGPATAALTNYISLIEAVEKQVATNQMKPEEAAEYVQLGNKNYKAALGGSTLADEQERMRADRRAKNTLGKDLINQRVSSGSSLAAALTSAAFGSDIMMPQGQSTLGYSPSLLALETTKELGGGQQVSDFAKSMLMAEEAPWL